MDRIGAILGDSLDETGVFQPIEELGYVGLCQPTTLRDILLIHALGGANGKQHRELRLIQAVRAKRGSEHSFGFCNKALQTKPRTIGWIR